MMKKLPIGIQTFAKLRDPEENYVYVDKTEILLQLVESGEYFFLSRPRRFGKSVMLSTLYELFSGNRDLFNGLYIEDKWDWERKFPVIRISFGGGEFRTEEKFDAVIYHNLKHNQQWLAISCDDPLDDPGYCFAELIRNAASRYKEKVVILIDEYDKPILDHITDRELARFNRDKLKGFYSIMKDLDEYIRFVMITGVSKFAKMNLFSGLNNLDDITIDERFATICGYTHQEVELSFAERLQGVDMDKLRQWYNGYNYFGDPLYNPFDILLFLSKNREYRPYWWSTGNPSFLIDLLNEQRRYLPELENCVVDDIILDSFDVDHIDIVALLWQTGYLTFAEKIDKFDSVVYKLKVPNKEIQMSLNALFIDYFTDQRSEKLELRSNLYDALQAGDLETFHNTLHALFAGIPYQNYANKIIEKYEGYYASVIYAYLASLGLPLVAEDVSSKGRVDMSIILPQAVYVIEFKVDNAPGSALEQIKEKGYHRKYMADDRTVYIIGIGFDSNKKNITEFEWEKV
ncbi:ATP-binding protein [Desulfolithobacter dissulfuricans]|nr:ATP-binding protein [Desulfolithobacter dissulfuricans]